jgi:ferrous iron transport protein A
MNAPFHPDCVTLDQLGRGVRARVVAIGWSELGASEANRLRHFGFDEGVMVEQLHQGPFGRDPIAVRIGRMTVAIRRRHALAVKVQIEP